MRVWIDATSGSGGLPLFGMPLVEYLLRGLLASGTEFEWVRIELPADAPIPKWFSTELQAALPLQWSRGDWSLGSRLQHALQDAAGEPLIALSADCVVDPRLINHLASGEGNIAFFSEADPADGALLRLEQELPEVAEDDSSLVAIARRAIRSGLAKEFSGSQFDRHVVALRREVPPYLMRVHDGESCNRAERFLFQINYKGSTDFMTSHVYPPLVWLMVRPLARWRVHPHWITALDILLAFGVVPIFAAGAWLPGLVLAYLMTVLDSVDGKLARLTHRTSKLGEILDHGTDILHPPLWYLAWGFALAGGDLSATAFTLSLWMFGLYAADRLCPLLFMWRTGRSIHGFRPLDRRVRTFVSRRNVNLPVFTLALVLDVLVPGVGFALPAFALIVAWQAACLVFHVARVARFWSDAGASHARAA
ncbi:MAG: CDP-alcohol phosphatidyltransferase family protein [Myxococcota bacterium]